MKNYGYVRNPLTVIAIFAAIAEISGTTVLPFISEANQATYVWFLMFFPALLVVIFFLTLNFNHKVLYAPSDYRDESNFLKMFGAATNQERADKLQEEVAEAFVPSDAPPAPGLAETDSLPSGENGEVASVSGTEPSSSDGVSLGEKIRLAERLAISDLSARLGKTFVTGVRFAVNGKRHYVFDGVARDGDAVEVVEVKLIRYLSSVFFKFEKFLLEAELIASRAPKRSDFLVHMCAVIDDDMLRESGRLSVESVTREMERAVSKYTVKVDISVFTLSELKGRNL